MIWDHIPSAALFGDRYGAFVLALEGAVMRGVDTLKLRNPRLSVVNGSVAVGNAVNTTRPEILALSRLCLNEAIQLGADHASGVANPDLLPRAAQSLERIVLNMLSIDESKAQQIIRDQALAYDLAIRTMPHQAALMKAVGELGDGAFTMLDRANRQFKSADLAAGYVRMFAARAYVESFVHAASDRGFETAFMLRPGHERVKFSLTEFQQVRQQFFHPNTPYELRLEE